MLLADPKHLGEIKRWAKSPHRWHRRAATVALIRGSRQQLFFEDVSWLAEQLHRDRDDMVQKGLGWLLRETAKADPKRTIPLLLRLRGRAPRLVLRTACETLKPAERARILG
jgi:3-methyladenine DNA glycosylase AlkD